MKRNYIFCVCLLLTATCGAQQNNTVATSGNTQVKKEFRYTNPITRDSAISMRDHFIIRWKINGIV